MPDESEAIQADVFVEFGPRDGPKLRGKPVPYLTARKIMALLHAFDRTADYEATLVPALEAFSSASGLTDERITATYPALTLGGLMLEIQRFFFQSPPTSANGAASPKTPDSTKPRAGEPGA